jgi:phosphoserine phosphatase RsbU/P
MALYRLIQRDVPKPQEWLLAPGAYLVGRDASCDIVIDHLTVSRRHAKLDVDAQHGVRVTDLGSRNGIRINQRRLRKQQAIAFAGDQLSFGDVRLLLQPAGQPPAQPDAQTKGVTITERLARHSHISGMPIEEALASLSLSDGTAAQAFKALSELAGLLATHQRLEDMFSEALERLAHIIPGQRYAVLLSERDPDLLEINATYLLDPDDSRSFDISRTILREVVTKKRAVYFSDLGGDQRFTSQDSVVLQGIRSAMAVPLVDQERVLGILYIDTSESGERYDPRTLKLAATCGYLLAAKITQQHLLHEQQSKQAMEAEMLLAARMQQDLMPLDLPEAPGYTFHAHLAQSRLVGGDLYDVAHLPDGRMLFLEADVAGKGMGAALLASNILSAFRILLGFASFDVLDAVQRASRQLLETSKRSDFATLFIGVLDTAKNSVEYINAGHNPPLFMPFQGNARNLEFGEVPMGVLGDFTWTRRTLTLAPGDRLLLYTDGLLDAANEEGRLYAHTGLLQFVAHHKNLPASDFLRELIDDIQQFMGEESPTDDLTVLLVERNRTNA